MISRFCRNRYLVPLLSSIMNLDDQPQPRPRKPEPIFNSISDVHPQSGTLPPLGPREPRGGRGREGRAPTAPVRGAPHPRHLHRHPRDIVAGLRGVAGDRHRLVVLLHVDVEDCLLDAALHYFFGETVVEYFVAFPCLMAALFCNFECWVIGVYS